MRIGFVCDLSEDDFSFASDNGFRCIEYWAADDTSFLAREKELCGYVRDYGVEFNQIALYGRNFISGESDERNRHLSDAKRMIDFCESIGCPLFVTGAGHEEGLSLNESCDRAIDQLGEIINYGKSKGIRTALYTCHWTNFAFAPEAWEIILPALPDLGLKYDPAHAVHDGRDYLAELRDWGHKVYHVHAKGALRIGGKRFNDPLPGMDQIDWGCIFAVLYHHCYAGDINIEPHSKRWLTDLKYPGLLFSKRFLEQFIV